MQTMILGVLKRFQWLVIIVGALALGVLVALNWKLNLDDEAPQKTPSNVRYISAEQATLGTIVASGLEQFQLGRQLVFLTDTDLLITSTESVIQESKEGMRLQSSVWPLVDVSQRFPNLSADGVKVFAQKEQLEAIERAPFDADTLSLYTTKEAWILDVLKLYIPKDGALIVGSGRALESAMPQQSPLEFTQETSRILLSPLPSSNTLSDE